MLRRPCRVSGAGLVRNTWRKRSTTSSRVGHCSLYRRYSIATRTEHNWSAYVPDVWGCVATGTTWEEVERNIRVALALHFEVTSEQDAPIPAPGTWSTG